MTVFDARVHREGKWWMIHVSGVDGLTQTRRLSEAERMARELVAVTTDLPLSEVEVRLTVELEEMPDLSERTARISADRTEARESEQRAARDTAALARQLVDVGVPLRDIGTVLGVSHQRVHQLVGDHADR